MRASDKNLTVLSDAEREALYGLPDFDDFQRAEFFAMTEKEHGIVFQRNGLRSQLYCLLQIFVLHIAGIVLGGILHLKEMELFQRRIYLLLVSM